MNHRANLKAQVGELIERIADGAWIASQPLHDLLQSRGERLALAADNRETLEPP